MKPQLSQLRVHRLKHFIQGLKPLLYYPLWEKDGSTAKNYASDHLQVADATIVGATQNQPGQIGYGMLFDGTNDLVRIPANTIPAFTGTSTIGFICKVLTAVASDKPLVDCQWGQDNAGGWQILVNNGNLVQNYVADAVGRDTVAPAQTLSLTDGFHFIVVTKGTTQKLYVDGVLNNTNATPTYGTTEPITGKTLVFATNNPEDTFLHCIMQHVFVCNRELTAEEVLKLARIAHLT